MERIKRIILEDGDIIKVQWDVKLGRLSEGYARAGSHNKGLICLAPGMMERQKRVLLEHELWHELWGKADLPRFLARSTEELVLDALTGWHVDTMRRNPALVEFLYL